MRKAELIVVIRRIWLQHDIFTKQHKKNHNDETDLFVQFTGDIIDGLGESFSTTELERHLRIKQMSLRKEQEDDLTWAVIFDEILSEVIDTIALINKMPEDDRPDVVDAEAGDGICCICGKAIEGRHGHNPEPVADRKMAIHGAGCCADCNDLFVVPVRKLVWTPQAQKFGYRDEENEKFTRGREDANPVRWEQEEPQRREEEYEEEYDDLPPESPFAKVVRRFVFRG